MKNLNLLFVLFSLSLGNSALADPGKALARIASTASEKVCTIYSEETEFVLNLNKVKTSKTIYTEKVADVFKFRQYLDEAGSKFKKIKPSRSNRYIRIEGFTSEGVSKTLYELKGTSPNATLTHDTSSFGEALFEFILLNCPQYRLPWITE